MVRVPAGRFEPGSLQGYADERPAGSISVDAFWMDRTEVTNAQFEAFAKATGHVTAAEREGAAVVFRAPPRGKAVVENSWWRYTEGANWRHPEGPGSNLQGRMNQPVIHVTLADAQAYARWLGRDLPTEAQWEWAARGGGDAELLEREPRGPGGQASANYWQGLFPDLNTREDGFADRAPVGCFAANGYGLQDMIGNVWEWTIDAYRGARQPHGNGEPGKSVPRQAVIGEPMVIKGGSFLCAADYCMRYRAAARHPQEADLGVAHVGFRTVMPAR
jgi:formylglycine-generating enzyme required for sulfatase activity